MEHLFNIYKLLVFFSFVFYAFMGGLALSSNTKASENRIFAAVCFTLVVWVCSQLLSSIAKDPVSALIWRRVAGLGWGTLYSFLVHFFLVLCGEKKLLRKIWLYFVIYLPAVVNVFVFCILTGIAENEYHLYLTEFGWINKPESSLLDTFFSIYYISFSLAVIIILIRWGLNKNRNSRKQAGAMLVSYLVAIILGTITEILLSRLLYVRIPTLAPFFIAIPMITVIHWMRKSNLMKSEVRSDIAVSGIILSEAGHIRTYRFLSMIFLLMGFVNLMLYFFLDIAVIAAFQFSIISTLIGIALYYLPGIFNSSFHRDSIMIPAMNISVVLILLHFTNMSLDIYMWPFPVFLIMIAIIFNKIFLLVSITSTAITANFIIGSLKTGSIIEYVPRAVFIVIASFLSFNINKIYLKRLKDNEEQVFFQRMVSNISSKLVSINKENYSERLTSILEDFGSYYHAENAGLITFSEKQQGTVDSLEWHSGNGDCRIDLMKNYLKSDSSWFLDQLSKNEIVFLDNLDGLPAQSESLRITLEKCSVSRLIAIPIFSREEFIGIIFMNFTPNSSFEMNIDTDKMLRIPTNIVADALAKIDSEEKINYLAYFDPLTELPNRELFNDLLDKAIALAVRSDKFVAVIMMDLDSFKNVNDTMGHDAGDLLLRKVAARLSGIIRRYDTMARFGGDEFLFILTQLDHRNDAARIVEKLIQALSEPIKLAGEEFFVTASFGISLCPEDAGDADSIIKNSDLAMYESKEQGKNRFTFYNSEMKEYTHEKMRLSSDLFRAVEKDEFFLEFQPQVDVGSSRIIGFEALLRWQHPARGLISPMVFIPLAEEVGLISKIGRWVLYTACRENKLLQEKGFTPVRVAVNLSVKQFRSGDLTKDVMEILSQTGLAPEYLELEITESVAIGETYNIIDTLKELRALGITISIDDFGTEYSSLSRLKQLSIDRIKIDKQFVQGVSMSKNDESIINFIVDLSKSMGVKVIAEGVETDIQLSYLKEKKCDEIQGFYFYKPLNIVDLENAMKSMDERH